MAGKNLQECIFLYVEDDDADASLFQLALQEVDLNSQLFRVSNANEAHAFLFRDPPYDKAPRPDLMLLDLNLPGEDGFCVLEKVRKNPEFHRMHVVVFSSSSAAADRARSKALGADGYICKGSSFDDFLEAAGTACVQARVGRHQE